MCFRHCLPLQSAKPSSISLSSHVYLFRRNSQVRRVLCRGTYCQHSCMRRSIRTTYLGMLTMAGVSAAAFDLLRFGGRTCAKLPLWSSDGNGKQLQK